MQVDGIGERPIVDWDGFPVVWVGGDSPVCQDPGLGGTNCYGPGAVFFDAEWGSTYQLGSDWHLRSMADPASSADQAGAAATQADPSVNDPTQNFAPGDVGAQPQDQGPVETAHFFYVDTGEIVETWQYSDGTAYFSNTGVMVNLPDGTASSDIGGLTSQQAAPLAPAQGSQTAPTLVQHLSPLQPGDLNYKPAPTVVAPGNRTPIINRGLAAPTVAAPARTTGGAPAVSSAGGRRAPTTAGPNVRPGTRGLAGTPPGPSLGFTDWFTNPQKRLVPGMDNGMLAAAGILGYVLLSGSRGGGGRRRR